MQQLHSGALGGRGDPERERVFLKPSVEHRNVGVCQGQHRLGQGGRVHAPADEGKRPGVSLACDPGKAGPRGLWHELHLAAASLFV